MLSLRTVLPAIVLSFTLSLTAKAAMLPAQEHDNKHHGEAGIVVYNWIDYIGKSTLPDFTKATNIPVDYHTYSSNEELDKILKSSAVADIAVPTAMPYFSEQVQAGLFQPIEHDKLKNYKNLDATLMAKMANADPGNQYGIIYAWGTNGFGYNVEAITQRMPGAPTDSWNLVFDTKIVSKFADCGVIMLDSPSEIIPLVLKYLQLDPNSQKSDDLAAARNQLMKIAPYIREFTSENHIETMADGKACIAIGYSGDMLQARAKAIEGNKAYKIDYTLPKEGTLLWFDMIGIPASSNNIDAAYAFIDYILRPDVAASFSNEVNYATAVTGSIPLINKDIRDDADIFPPDAIKSRLFMAKAVSPAYRRLSEDMWKQIKAAKPATQAKNSKTGTTITNDDIGVMD